MFLTNQKKMIEQEVEPTEKKEKTSLVITRKMQVACIDDKEKKDEFWLFARSLNDKIFRIANSIMSNHYVADALAEHITPAIEEETTQKFWKAFGKAKRENIKELQEKVWEMSQQNLGYNLTKGYNEVPSFIRSALSQKVYQDFNNDLLEVKQGKRTQRTYRKGIAIPFTRQAIRDLLFLEKECFFEFFGHKMTIVFGKDRSKNIPILERIISGENDYALCDSSLSIEGKKIFINFCVRIPKQKKELIEDREAYADISFIAPIMLSNNVNKEIISVGDKTLNDGSSTMEHLHQLRKQVNKQHEGIQQASKYAKGGHGRKRKLQAQDRFEEKEKAIAKTENHRLTKWVIDEVIKLRAKTLVITRRKLSEEEEKQKFQLRFWGYADIISMLKFKASKYDITVIDKTDVNTVLEKLQEMLVFGETYDRQETMNILCEELGLDSKTIKQRIATIIKNRTTFEANSILQEIGKNYVLVPKQVQE